MARSNARLAKWFAERISDAGGGVFAESEIAGVTVEADGTITIGRRSNPPVRVATIDVDPVDKSCVTGLVQEHGELDFVLHAGQPRVLGEAIEAASDLAVAIGPLADLYRAMDLERPGTYVHRETEFLERGLRQHQRVAAFLIIERGYYLLRRIELPDLRAAFVYEYEMTVDSFRSAIDRFSGVEVVVTSHASARPISDQVLGVASQVGVEALRWAEFYGSLNRP